MSNRDHRQSGFALIELLLAITVSILLVITMVKAVSDYKERVITNDELEQTFSFVKEAVNIFYFDHYNDITLNPKNYISLPISYLFKEGDLSKTLKEDLEGYKVNFGFLSNQKKLYVTFCGTRGDQFNTLNPSHMSSNCATWNFMPTHKGQGDNLRTFDLEIARDYKDEAK